LKNLFFYNILIFVVLVICGPLQAKVTGQCSNCHTMHNSQGRQPMAYLFSNGVFSSSETPNPSLLVSDCVGCHTNDGTSTIVNGVPIVYNTQVPSNPLAGGNFYYVVNDGDTRGHNVLGIKGTDLVLGLTPPGGTALASQLRCAGLYGCHGNRSISDQLSAMKGAHHTDDSGGIDGSSVGMSYRFLNGILGKEDSDWEQDNTNLSHNEYKGATDFTTSTSISSLCGQCHGDFHSSTGVGSGTPWFRHPSDYTLPASGEYQYYNNGTLDYSMIAPIARPDPSNVIDTTKITPGTDIVMCLSCHRVHGSPYYKMLRWDYCNPNLSEALSGCNVCHTHKN